MKKHYQIIPRNLCVIFKKDQILLLKGRIGKRHWSNTYNALGGHIEEGEELYLSARREIYEESKIKIDEKEISLKGIIHVKTYFKEDVFMFIFTAEVQDVNLVDSNEGHLEWINIDQINNMSNIAEDIKIIVPKLKKLKKGEIISGISSYNVDKHLTKFEIKILNT